MEKVRIVENFPIHRIIFLNYKYSSWKVENFPNFPIVENFPILKVGKVENFPIYRKSSLKQQLSNFCIHDFQQIFERKISIESSTALVNY